MVELALDVRHLARYTDNIIPTSAEYVVEADASTGNYAYMVDDKANIISHPLDYHIAGLYKDGTPVPPITPQNKDEMVKKGEEVLNLLALDGLEPALAEVAKEAQAGKAGIKNYTFEGRTKMVAYAPIPFYAGEYAKPAGFGWVGLGIDIEKFSEQAKIATEKIEKEGQKWLATIIVILLGAMIILFGIAVMVKGLRSSEKIKGNWSLRALIVLPLSLAAFGILICVLLNRYQFVNLPGDVYFIKNLPVSIQGQDFFFVCTAASWKRASASDGSIARASENSRAAAAVSPSRNSSRPRLPSGGRSSRQQTYMWNDGA